MKYDINPYLGVGPISFGMSRQEVRNALDVQVEGVAKTDTGIPADFFEELGIFVYYKQPGVCEAVELFGPASPNFNGKHLLGSPYRDLEQWMNGLDPKSALNDAGLTSYKFGFGLYAPSAMKEPDLPVDGVIVFERGYYDV